MVPVFSSWFCATILFNNLSIKYSRVIQLLFLPPQSGNRMTTPENSPKQWFSHVPVNTQMEHVSGGFSSFLRWILFLTIDYEFIWCATTFDFEPPLSTALAKSQDIGFQPVPAKLRKTAPPVYASSGSGWGASQPGLTPWATCYDDWDHDWSLSPAPGATEMHPSQIQNSRVLGARFFWALLESHFLFEPGGACINCFKGKSCLIYVLDSIWSLSGW